MDMEPHTRISYNFILRLIEKTKRAGAIMNTRKIVCRAVIIAIVLFAIAYILLRLYLNRPRPKDFFVDDLGMPMDIADELKDKAELLYHIDLSDFGYVDALEIAKFDSDSSRIIGQTLDTKCKEGEGWAELPMPEEIMDTLHGSFSDSVRYETNPDASELFYRTVHSDNGWWRFEYRYGLDLAAPIEPDSEYPYIGEGYWEYRNAAKTPIDPDREISDYLIFIFDSDEGVLVHNEATH